MASRPSEGRRPDWDALKTFAGPRRLTLVVEGLPTAAEDRNEEVKGPETSAPGSGARRLPAQDRPDAATSWSSATASGSPRSAARAARRPRSSPRWSIRSSAASPGPSRCAGARERCAGCARCKRILAPVRRRGGAVRDRRHRTAATSPRATASWARGQPFTVKDFADYRAKLETRLRRAGRRPSASSAFWTAPRPPAPPRGLELVDDDGLLDEVAGLAEWPTPILGDMDPQFLDLPPEVIRTSMQVHQKYFAVRDPAKAGKLGPALPRRRQHRGHRRRQGDRRRQRRVLSARLNDARFFWDEDRKVGFDAWLDEAEGRHLPRQARHHGRARRAHRGAGARDRASGRRRRRSGRAGRAPVQGRPGHAAWSASSPNCRASWAATTPAGRPARRRRRRHPRPLQAAGPGRRRSRPRR